MIPCKSQKCKEGNCTPSFEKLSVNSKVFGVNQLGTDKLNIKLKGHLKKE
jgi:hypothetical protein